MKIFYTYKIINVDKQNKSMEIIYESPDYGVLHVGARLPWKNETIESVVKMYSPVNYWLEKEKETLDVDENTEGSQEIELKEEEKIDPEVEYQATLDRYRKPVMSILREVGLVP